MMAIYQNSVLGIQNLSLFSNRFFDQNYDLRYLYSLGTLNI